LFTRLSVNRSHLFDGWGHLLWCGEVKKRIPPLCYGMEMQTAMAKAGA